MSDVETVTSIGIIQFTLHASPNLVEFDKLVSL